MPTMYDTVIAPAFVEAQSVQHYPADAFPTMHPVIGSTRTLRGRLEPAAARAACSPHI
jgi:hypothetical protein